MPTPTTFATAKVFVGVAKETTQGTPVAMVATIPVDKFDAEDKPVWLDDQAIRGSMVEIYGRQQGVIKTEFTISGPAFGDTLGWLVGNLMGDLTTTGTTPLTHAFSVLNSGTGQPTSHTFTQFQGPPASVGTRQFPGACLSELTLKWNAETQLLMYDAKGSCWPSVIPGATPTSAPSTVTPWASWRSILGIGGPASGGTQVKTVMEGEITLKRKLDMAFTGQLSQNPYIIQRGPVTAAGKLRFIAADESPYTTMLGNTQPQLQWIVDNGVAAGGQVQVKVDCQNAAYATSKPDWGKNAVQYDATWDAIANTTNAGASGGVSPAKVTLINSVASGTYL